MKKLPRWLPSVTLGFLLGFGFFLGFLYFCYSVFEATVTLGNLIQAFATLVAGFIVAAYIQKKTQVDIKQNELFVRQIDLVSDQLLEIGAFDFVVGVQFTRITAILKQIGNRVSALQTVAARVGYDPQVRNMLEMSWDLRELRRLATDTPHRAEALAEESDAEVAAGIIRLGQTRCELLQIQVEQMRTKFFEAQISVTRS